MPNFTKNKQVYVKKIGLIEYKQAWKMQEALLQEIITRKSWNRKLGPQKQQPPPNYLLFCEHPHVYTLGKKGDAAHLRVTTTILRHKQLAFYLTNRGGDMTYHGPGQLVLYPILDLEQFFTDIHHYLRLLEEAVIATLRDFGLTGGRIKGLTGVWVDYQTQHQARKLCAVGIRVSRWVTMHGMALNVQPDLKYFEHIIPCGIQDKKVTSMAHELGVKQDSHAVMQRLQQHMLHLFGMELVG